MRAGFAKRKKPMNQMDPNIDPNAVARRMLKALEEMAERTVMLERYVFWTRIWAFVMVALLVAILFQLDDVIIATKSVKNALEINAIIEKYAEN